MLTEKERIAMVKKIKNTVKYFNRLTDAALRLDLVTATHVDDDGDLVLDEIIRKYH